jgi:hypothetical protein
MSSCYFCGRHNRVGDFGVFADDDIEPIDDEFDPDAAADEADRYFSRSGD